MASEGDMHDDNYSRSNDMAADIDMPSTDDIWKNYTVLSEADIRQRQEDHITEVSTVLCISKAAASILLRHYHWNVGDVQEAWFHDEARVRKTVGLLERPIVQFSSAKDELLTCGICFGTNILPICDRIISTDYCGHSFCTTCWRFYIERSIDCGPGCLMLSCPDQSCGAAIDQDMIDLLASCDGKEKYARYLLRSYVECKNNTKWCPTPGCEYVFEFEFVRGGGGGEVACHCSYRFCWDCMEEAHRPLDCGTVAEWIVKNNAESENTKWILAYTKLCPMCKTPIEKNQGIMLMKCMPPCDFEFCWICLGAWSGHGREGYQCNIYEADVHERRRNMAKNSLDRYTHYYEWWETHQLSMQKALADLHKMQTTGKLDELCEKQAKPKSMLKFIVEAWQQIVECRRVLKWSYAYGYYLPKHERAKRQFFEYLQGEAEAILERLHQCAEKDLQVYLNAKAADPSDGFHNFKEKLVRLTSITRNYFEKFVKGLENGLLDVDSKGGCTNTASSKSVEAPQSGRPSSYSDWDDSGDWSCEHCTYINVTSATMCCEMCFQYK